MHWKFTLYSVPLFVSAMICTALLVYALKRRSTAGALPFALLMVALAVWSVGYALELMNPRFLWVQVKFLGVVTTPLLWLAVVLQYTGRKEWLRVRQLIGLVIIPAVVSLVFIWTNEMHGLMWREVRPETIGSWVVLRRPPGPWFRIHTTYFYVILLFGAFLLLLSLIHSSPLYRGQASVMLISAFVPWLANIAYLSGRNPFPHLDLTPFFFPFTGLAFAWGLFRFALLDLVPIARETLFEEIKDAVIALDAQDRVVSLNPAAERIIDRPAKAVIGQPVAEAFAHCPSLVEHLGDMTEVNAEITIGEGETQRYYDRLLSPLHDRRNRPSGRLLFLHDITERKLAEVGFYEALRALFHLQMKGDFIQFIREFPEQTASLFNATVSFYLFDPKGDGKDALVLQGSSDPQLKGRLGWIHLWPGEGIGGWVEKTARYLRDMKALMGQTVQTVRLPGVPKYPEIEFPYHFLPSPLLTPNGRLLGLIWLTRPCDQAAFTDTDAKLLITISGEMAQLLESEKVAERIQYTPLLQAIQRLKVHITQLAQKAQLDRDAILYAILRAAAELSRATNGTLGLVNRQTDDLEIVVGCGSLNGGGRDLFTVSSKYQTDLDHGTLPEAIRDGFETYHEKTPSQDVTVFIEEAGHRWSIVDRANKRQYIIEKDGGELYLFEKLPPMPKGFRSITRYVVNHGAPYLCLDVTKDPSYFASDPFTRSEICVPIQRADQTIGVINLESQELAHFSGTDLHALMLFSIYAGAAIAAAEGELPPEGMQTSLEIGQQLLLVSSIDDQEVILQRVAAMAAKAIGCKRISIWLKDSTGRRLELRAAFGGKERFAGRLFYDLEWVDETGKKGEGLTGKVATGALPPIRTLAAKEVKGWKGKYNTSQFAHPEPAGSLPLMIIPLRTPSGKIIGVIRFSRPTERADRHDKGFNERDEVFGHIIAQQIATVLATYRLLNRFETLIAIGEQMLLMFPGNQQEMLTRAIALATETIQCKCGTIWIKDADEKRLKLAAGCGGMEAYISQNLFYDLEKSDEAGKKGEDLVGLVATGALPEDGAPALRVLAASDVPGWERKFDDLMLGPTEDARRVPMILVPVKMADDEIIGVVQFLSPQPRPDRPDGGFNKADENFAVALARLISMGIGTTQLVDDLNRAKTSLEAQTRQLRQAKDDAEQAKEKANAANQAKTVFLKNMSHDIRSPLTPLLNQIEALEDIPDLPTDVREKLAVIKKWGNVLLTLIGDALDLSVFESGQAGLKPIDFDLVALIDDLSFLFQQECKRKGLTWRVEWQIQSDVSTVAEGSAFRIPVNGDASKLERVLMNLLSNAVKFTDSGGVLLRMSRLPNGEVGESVQLHDVERFTFEVIDTGPGIPIEEKESTFEPFYQGVYGAKRGGSGLGLPIARQLVQLVNGELRFSSEPGKGSRFFVTVPLPPAKGELTQPVTDMKGIHLAPGRTVKALIAEDRPDHLDVLQRILSDIGVEVVTAADGLEAENQFRSHRPDIVFMDIAMPTVDGIEALHRIRDKFGADASKIVAISAQTGEWSPEKCLKEGFDDFIEKPYSRAKIYNCLSKLLGVEYIREGTPVSPDPDEMVDFSGITLPDALLSKMRDAVSLIALSDLNDCIDKVKEYLGPQGQGFVDYLRNLRERCDVEALEKVLAEISTASDRQGKEE